jgi:uncharacterized membrane protein YeaQ/YmgE (transglycosylase-associated protein family)
MGLIVYLILGIVVGWLASVVVKEAKPNVVKDIILGFVGAIIGDLIMKYLFQQPGLNEVTVVGFIGVLVVSIIVIAIGRAFKGSEEKK